MLPGNKAREEAIRYSRSRRRCRPFLRARGAEETGTGRSVFATKRDYRNNAKSILACSLEQLQRGIYEKARVCTRTAILILRRAVFLQFRDRLFPRSYHRACDASLAPFLAVGIVSLGINSLEIEPLENENFALHQAK